MEPDNRGGPRGIAPDTETSRPGVPALPDDVPTASADNGMPAPAGIDVPAGGATRPALAQVEPGIAPERRAAGEEGTNSERPNSERLVSSERPGNSERASSGRNSSEREADALVERAREILHEIMRVREVIPTDLVHELAEMMEREEGR